MKSDPIGIKVLKGLYYLSFLFLSGPSDPLVVTIGHLVNPHLRRVTIFLNVTNLTPAELKNVGVSFGLAGQIELPASKSVPFLKLSNLDAEQTGQLEIR
jgi:hypothetical protein